MAAIKSPFKPLWKIDYETENPPWADVFETILMLSQWMLTIPLFFCAINLIRFGIEGNPAGQYWFSIAPAHTGLVLMALNVATYVFRGFLGFVFKR